MKIGINLVGVYNGERNRNFNKTKNSILEKVINCWEKNEVNVYLTTYSADEDSELIEFYSPKKYQFIPYKGDYSGRNETYRESLGFLEGEDIDFIVSTRFDIHFNQSISSLNIDFNKINFLFREGTTEWENEKLVCDNLFCLPFKYREYLIQSLLESNQDGHTFTHSHRAYSYLLPKIGEENMHFISDINEYSHSNRFYNLMRHD
jgi:hypothetical protein